MASIDLLLKRSGGIAAGVPTLRHALALGVTMSAAIEVHARYASLRGTILGIVVPAAPIMLLAVTGFLLAKSAAAPAGGHLPIRYARRLLPPLLISLLTTIITLGPLASNVGVRRYFTAAQTWQFIGNAIGWSSNQLPGVFEFNNSSGVVNALLWLAPTVLAGCLVATLARRVPADWQRGVYMVGLVAITVAAAAIDRGLIDKYDIPRALRYWTEPRVVGGAAGLIAGMAGYAWRRRLPVGGLTIMIALVAVGGAALYPRFWTYIALGHVLLALPLAYLALALAVAWLPTPWPLTRVNYSLGMVLYAYPVAQLCIALGGADQSLSEVLLVGLPITLALAAASWHLVERPLRTAGRGPVLVSGGGHPVGALLRPFGWYSARLRRAVPAGAMILSLAAVMLALLAVAMFALQRDQSGM